MAVCLGVLLSLIVPIKIIHFSLLDIQRLLILKTKLCTCRGKFLCKKCKKIQSHLLKSYHSATSYEEELATRLLYECLFNFITLHDIQTGSWKYPCGRDHGHHLRITKIADKCCIKNIKWL
jgi:hypothetical protein